MKHRCSCTSTASQVSFLQGGQSNQFLFVLQTEHDVFASTLRHKNERSQVALLGKSTNEKKVVIGFTKPMILKAGDLDVTWLIFYFWSSSFKFQCEDTRHVITVNRATNHFDNRRSRLCVGQFEQLNCSPPPGVDSF